jgi:hypothetical protein
MKKTESATSVEAIMASAPASAEQVVPAVKNAAGQLDLVKFLSDFEEHASGIMAMALYGRATPGTRDKMRDLIRDINQAALEGKGAAFVYHTRHGWYQLKKVVSVERAAELDKQEYKDPVQNKK